MILASASPRRQALLRHVVQRANFKVMPATIDEVALLDELSTACKTVEDLVATLALHKALAVAQTTADPCILGADTVIALPTNETHTTLTSQILGKPRDLEHARAMIKAMAGKTHRVITGCALVDSTAQPFVTDAWSAIAHVTFYPLSDDEIDSYLEVAGTSLLDKAGAYAIQEHGRTLIESINGSYDVIVGLPVAQLIHEKGAWFRP